MDNNCQIVVFSDKAYNAIIRETFEWEPVETGGILLGHILDNGCWIVMEVLPPGYGEGREGDNVYHEMGYFEYNQKFVNYLAKSVAEQYEIPLELLGLWHRHPGSLDRFSGTDDGTNSTFAAQNPRGVISGLINVDPHLRMTMYYLSHADSQFRNFRPLNYQRVKIEVGSDLIPEQYFKLRYYDGHEADLHPLAPQRKQKKSNVDNGHDLNEQQVGQSTQGPENIQQDNGEGVPNGETSSYNEQYPKKPLSAISDFTQRLKKNKTAIILIVALIAFIFSAHSIRKDFENIFNKIKMEQPVVVKEKTNDAKETTNAQKPVLATESNDTVNQGKQDVAVEGKPKSDSTNSKAD